MGLIWDMGAILLGPPTVVAQDATSAELVESYCLTLQSEKSKQTMRQSLNRAARALGAKTAQEVPWTRFGLDELSLLRTRLADAHAPATANLTLSAVRTLLHVAFVQGKISAQQFEAVKFVKRVKGSRLERGRSLSADDERQLRAHFSALPGYRAVMLSTALVVSIGAGLRLEELCRLAVEAYTKGLLKVRGKGNKERPMPVDGDMAQSLDAWLSVRQRLYVEHGGLFVCPCLPDRPLSKWAWWSAVRQAADIANVALSGPHDFRRTFASRLLDAGYDLRQVQELMGHESVETTGRYDKRELEALHKKRLQTRIVTPMA